MHVFIIVSFPSYKVVIQIAISLSVPSEIIVAECVVVEMADIKLCHHNPSSSVVIPSGRPIGITPVPSPSLKEHTLR